MSVIGSNILAGASGQGGGYNLTNSLRFRSSASAYLNRTPASASNRQVFTWSSWVKRGQLTAYQDIFTGGVDGNDNTRILWFNVDTLFVFAAIGGNLYGSKTTAVFRDPSAWYHVVVAFDTTQATDINRVKIYVNGVQQTTTSNYSGYIPQNSDLGINTASEHRIADSAIYTPDFMDGYLAEMNFVDGQQLTPSSFGQTSATTGVWQPKKYAGTYGTNGFYLPFTDNSALTTSSNVGLGKDFSGNGNYWTTNNISITSGVTYDSMKDVPTLTDETTANYCVMNPLDKRSIATVSNGNLHTTSDTSGSWGQVRGTMAFPTSGKFYWEVTLSTSNTEDLSVGIGTDATSLSLNFAPSSWANYYGILDNGDLYVNNSSTSGYGTSFSNGNVFMIAFDRDNSKIYFGRNGTWFNSSDPAAQTNPAASGISTSLTFFPMTGASGFTPPTGQHNFGQRPFAYTPPTGFVALNTFNLPTPTIGATASTQANKYFDATTYTGGASATTVVNSGGMQPDWIWQKPRVAGDHILVDAVRGVNKNLDTAYASAEFTGSYITAFNSNGFTTNASNGDPYVGWQWKANGAGSSNTAGSITSTVSANTSAGFSIVTYTGTQVASTIGHGLGVAPSFIVAKNRGASGMWICYHIALTANGWIYLNDSTGSSTSTTVWNNTTPTSTVFSVNGAFDNNKLNNTYVAYCFAEVAGYSKFGSYAGNASANGAFVYCGFKPKYVMIKSTFDTTRNWIVQDGARNPNNAVLLNLYPNLSNAEGDTTGGLGIDFVSNGFKIRNQYGNQNGSGETYIFMAFAETPFKYSTAR